MRRCVLLLILAMSPIRAADTQRGERAVLTAARQAPPSAAPTPAPQVFTVPAGTRIPLTLRNPVDTKHSREGDRIYLETAYPIAENGRVAIPRGSFVNGTVTQSKPAGALKGKGELYIRFDSLVLPNGTTRDFRSRLASADKEGKVTGTRDGSGDARTTAEGAGIGATVGGVAGSTQGHALKGAGVGALAGAAGGLIFAHVKHRPDAVLPRGTTVEMVLDRDLTFESRDLP
jgi:type IV secretion system protein VirB10